ncbi:MAG: asparagine synthase-related protein [Burkholderiales bacterium]
MSGIAGIVQFDGAPAPPGLVERMTAAMADRGPDRIDHWTHGAVALGQCMLATTPESLDERQPLANEDTSVVLVMDGRVDDRDELRRELLARGAVLRDRTDAELVLRAYESWGEDCPRHLIGEFAFVVWDGRRRRLFAARDAAGTRYFHYRAGDGWFGFASEIGGLLALGRFTPRLNETRLLDYLIVEFDRDDEVGTFYEGVRRLPAGHAMTVDWRGTRTWRYWDPMQLSPLRFGSKQECAEAFLDTLRIAVKCRLRGNGPVGAALSGGLDSSSIVGLIRSEFRSELQRPLRTFSLIRDDRENCADWHGISAMLREGWIEPTIITSAAARDAGATFLADLCRTDEPFTLSGGFPDMLVWDAARAAGCRVLLDGMAGDLLFLHLRQSLAAAVADGELAHVPGVLTAYRRHGVQGGPRDAASVSLRRAAPERLRALYRRLRPRRASGGGRSEIAGDLRHVVAPALAMQHVNRRIADRLRACTRDRANGHRAVHARNFTTGCLSFAHEVNGQAMLARGLEPRSPFSDRRLLEFAVRMPLSAKIATGWYKRLARECTSGILPDEVRWRTTLGQHPGPAYYDALIGRLRATKGGMWSFDRLSDTLGHWVCATRLRTIWNEQLQPDARSAGFDVLMLAILGEWITARRSVQALAD